MVLLLKVKQKLVEGVNEGPKENQNQLYIIVFDEMNMSHIGALVYSISICSST